MEAVVLIIIFALTLGIALVAQKSALTAILWLMAQNDQGNRQIR
jgi:hypothetical protein